MKILELEVKGFSSLRDVLWKPGALNVVIGPNASGKSNLLRLLELLAVSAQGRLGKHIQRAGGMEPLVWDGTEDHIAVRCKASPLEDFRDAERDSLTYVLKLDRVGRTSAYQIGLELLGNYRLVEIGQKTEPKKFLERILQRAHIFDFQEQGLHGQATQALLASHRSHSHETQPG